MLYLIRIAAVISFMFLAVALSGCGSPPVTKSPVAPSTPPPVRPGPKIITFGDSLTAGFGLDSWEQSYPALLQKDIDAAGYDLQVVNLGLSGDTAVGGLARLDIALGYTEMRIFVLELGANDVVHKGDAAELKQKLSQIVERIRSKNIDVLLCGVKTPTRHGEEYSAAVDAVYRDIAQQYQVTLMPDFMAGVGGNADLLLPDGVHENEAGARIIEKNVFEALKPILAKYEKKKR